MAHDAFICYAKEDGGLAMEIVQLLEEGGVECWVAPRDVPRGAEWTGAIVSAIKQSRRLILLLSQHANASQYVLTEINIAQAKGVPRVTVRIEDVAPTDSLEFHILTRQWYEARGPERDNVLRDLLADLQDELGIERPALVPETAEVPPVGGVPDDRALIELHERELRVAAQVQERLFPSGDSRHGTLEIALGHEAAAGLLADFCDVYPVSGDRLIALVGDVSGHGIGPALHAAECLAVVRAMTQAGTGVGEAVSACNALLSERSRDDLFATCIVLDIEGDGRAFRYVCAGHVPGIHVRGDGSFADALAGTGMAMGILGDSPYALSSPRRLSPGDCLVLVTDGVTEAQSSGRTLYGDERLLAALQACAPSAKSAADVLAGITRDVEAFRDGTAPNDDWVCMVIRATGDPA